MNPLLELNEARIDGAHGALFEGVSCTPEGLRVGLVGPWEPLFGLLSQRLRLLSGRVQIVGQSPREALQTHSVGVAPAAWVAPKAWRFGQYLGESAALLGVGTREAGRQVAEVVGRMGLERVVSKKIGLLSRLEYRVLALAQGALGCPKVLACESPFYGLDEAESATLAGLIDRAAQGSALLISSPALDVSGPERSLFANLDCLVRLGRAGVTAQGVPGAVLVAGARFIVEVTRKAPEFAQALTAMGCRILASDGDYGVEVASGTPNTGRARFRVELGSTVTLRELQRLALTLEAPLVELQADR